MNNESMRKALRRGQECPDREFLLSTAARPAAIDRHVESCGACQMDLKLYKEFVEPQFRPGEREAVNQILTSFTLPKLTPDGQPAARQLKAPWWKSLSMPVWAGTAALACSALLFTVGIGYQKRNQTEFRSHQFSGIDPLRSAGLSITSPTGELTSVPQVVAWNTVPGAARYEVMLFEVDRTRIFYATVTTPSLVLSAPTVRLIAPGKTVFLEILAKDAAGVEIADSGQHRMRLAGRNH